MLMVKDYSLGILKNMFFALNILMDYHIDIISNQLVLIVNCVNSYLFLSSILDHIINTMI